MKKEEFDIELKGKIENQIKAPEELKNRIRQEIRQIDNKKEKNALIRKMQGIAAVAVISILGVTSYAAITSNIGLERLGFFKASKNFEQNAVEINKEIENDYLKFTLNYIACDDTYLITENTIDFKDKAIEEYGNVMYDKEEKIYEISAEGDGYFNNQKIECWSKDIQKITDKEYKMLMVYDVSDVKEENIEFKWNIKSIRYDSEKALDGLSEYDMKDDISSKIELNKQISMNIERVENNRNKFEQKTQTVGNKTIIVKEAANTNFETIIKASIITKESYSEYLKEESTGLKIDDFMVTKTNGEDIAYEVRRGIYDYVIIDDGTMFTEKDLSKYMLSQKKNNSEEALVIEDYTIGEIKESDAINYEQIVNKYGKNEDLENRVVKIQRNYTIKVGNNENEEDIQKIKILPVTRNYISDRNDEGLEYYNNAEWYKLENKEYKATSELGGTLKISSIDITDSEIVFHYNTTGLIGEEALILMRKNNGKFNYWYPAKIETKGLSSDENKIVFYRKNNRSAGSNDSDITKDDVLNILEDISKDEFTMLFGKKNGTEFIGNGLELDIPNKITDKIVVKNIKIENYVEIEKDTQEDEQQELTTEEYSNLLIENQNSIEKIKSTGNKFDKNTASLSGIKIGSTIDEVHSVIKEEPEDSKFDGEDGAEHYSDDIHVYYRMKNNKYCVSDIMTSGRLITNTNIKVGDNYKKVIENYAKDDELLDIDINEYYRGWVLYGGNNAISNFMDYESGAEPVIKSLKEKNAYFMFSKYQKGDTQEENRYKEILYIDGDVYINFGIMDGLVSTITISNINETTEN